MPEKIRLLKELATKLGWSNEELLSEAEESGFLTLGQSLEELGVEKAQAFIEHLQEALPETSDDEDDEDDDDYEEDDDDYEDDEDDD